MVADEQTLSKIYSMFLSLNIYTLKSINKDLFILGLTAGEPFQKHLILDWLLDKKRFSKSECKSKLWRILLNIDHRSFYWFFEHPPFPNRVKIRSLFFWGLPLAPIKGVFWHFKVVYIIYRYIFNFSLSADIDIQKL